MYKASRMAGLAAKTGEPLPRVPFLRDMYKAGNFLYKGSLVMFAGMPAAYKSMFTLNLVHNMRVPTLYISADSDAATQFSRLSAMITQDQSRDIRKSLDQDDGQAYYSQAVEDSLVQFSLDANPDAFDIEAEINAWVELYDEYPEVIVVDNLRNVFSGQDNEHSGYKTVQQKLIEISRDTGACVITMHHMKEGGGRKSTDPAPRNAIDGMVAQLPGFILSIAREDDQFRLCVIKDREGPDHPEAEPEHWHTLRVDTATASFYAQDSVQSIAAHVADESWTPTKILESA